MNKLVEFETEDGAVVVVETADPATGTRLVARGEGGEGPVTQTARTFEGALAGVRSAAQAALRVFRDGALRPDSVELEFGVKLSAEAGAIIAKGAAEGQLVVRLGWSAERAAQPPATAPRTAAAPDPLTAAPHPLPLPVPEPMTGPESTTDA
ncbi:CU044_2847 family protein [Streptomyces sp. NK08204]|uniref:CU044_2847 family protein n=1 Tax=Streptomyces sp. NK08204 TaxID=2873260 RepID=UPI001CECB782|nr:CU044_2847 family protein [Streptomyces sp. NK08204]